MTLEEQHIKLEKDLDWIQLNSQWELGKNVPSFPIPKKKVSINEKMIADSLSFSKLGYYYEFLLHLILKANEYQVILNSKPIKDKNRTIGEVDFLVEKDGVITHVEVLVKFYLWDDREGVWMGSNRNDQLNFKLEKLFDKQLALDIPGYPHVNRAYIAQGVQFSNLNSNESLINGALIGQWLKTSEVVQEDGYYYLPRLSWLSGYGGILVLDWGKEIKEIEITKKARQYVLLNDDSILSRLFIVPDNWS